LPYVIVAARVGKERGGEKKKKRGRAYLSYNDLAVVTRKSVTRERKRRKKEEGGKEIKGGEGDFLATLDVTAREKRGGKGEKKRKRKRGEKESSSSSAPVGTLPWSASK